MINLTQKSNEELEDMLLDLSGRHELSNSDVELLYLVEEERERRSNEPWPVSSLLPSPFESFIDRSINRRAWEKGQWKREHDGDYDLFDRAGYIETCLKAGRPVVITWVSSRVKLHCRDYTDVHGVPDLFGIEEILTLFSGKGRMKSYRIFLIPYLLTGYDIPPELEQDPEPLVPFTAKTIEMVKEIEGEPVWPGWMR